MPLAEGLRGRYGGLVLERPAREVVEELLGGPVSPAALLEEMGRMRRTESP